MAELVLWVVGLEVASARAFASWTLEHSRNAVWVQPAGLAAALLGGHVRHKV